MKVKGLVLEARDRVSDKGGKTQRRMQIREETCGVIDLVAFPGSGDASPTFGDIIEAIGTRLDGWAGRDRVFTSLIVEDLQVVAKLK